MACKVSNKRPKLCLLLKNTIILTSLNILIQVSTFHKNHSGVTKEEAMMEYLKLAQDLEMFGITYYPVTNKQGSEVDMGIDSR